MIDLILDLLYPRTCGFCGRIEKEYICNKCEKKLQKENLCKIYKSKSKLINYHGYVFKYQGIIRDKIIDYKFNEQAYLYKTFSKIILKNEIICSFIKKYDIIIPVPIHKKRKKYRGYDQTQLIAKEIAKNLQVCIKFNILKKKNNIKPQSSLTKNERRLNIKDAYELQNEKEIYNKKVLLIDDIYTTGATIEECARIIKKAKPKEISAFTIAKD